MMAQAQSTPQAVRPGIGRGTFRSATTVLLKTSGVRRWKKEKKGKRFSKQEKLFITSLLLAAFGLGIITVTGLHLLVAG